jgi:hypothetical protein
MAIRVELLDQQRGAHILGISPLLLSRFASSSSVEMTGPLLGSSLLRFISPSVHLSFGSSLLTAGLK